MENICDFLFSLGIFAFFLYFLIYFIFDNIDKLPR